MPDDDAATIRIVADLGRAIRDERRRRGLTLRVVAERARVALSSVQKVERGSRGSLEMYVRIAHALDRPLELALGLAEPEDMGPVPGTADVVHASMGEREVATLGGHAIRCGVDEPWQSYRFSGRADVIASVPRASALLHIENRTQFPDVQDAVGRFNNKRAYLGEAIAARMGLGGPPRVETHVMVALWSTEVIDVLRAHPATFRAMCPDGPDAFLGWWRGRPPTAGVTSSLVLFDPLASGSNAMFASLDQALRGVEPRYPGYAAAARRLRSGAP